MKKNTAGQVIAAQMINAADGTAFSGAATVYVTKDGGTQASGGGTAAHEGQGCHSYAPTQAETNADHVAFTFTGTGAIPVTIQCYTTMDSNVKTIDTGAITASAIATDAIDADAIASDVITEILAGTGDTGVSLAKAIEMVAAFVAGKVSVSSAAGVSTYTYKKRDGTTTSFTSACSETDGTRATTGALS